MDFSEFLRWRRAQIEISQLELANRLTEFGQETSYARVSHWETGRNKPPLDDPAFRQSLALALDMSLSELLKQLGYEVNFDEMSSEAARAASIVEGLPEDGRQLALDLLLSLKKRYSVH